MPGSTVQADTIPICGSPSAWAEVNGATCSTVQNYPPNYVGNLANALTSDLLSARTLDSNGQYRSWISPTALGEASSGFYALVVPNNSTRMPLRYRGPYGLVGVTLPLARAPGGD
jgi:hypothetical protein